MYVTWVLWVILYYYNMGELGYNIICYIMGYNFILYGLCTKIIMKSNIFRSLSKLLSSKLLTRRRKIKLNHLIICPVLLNGVTEKDESLKCQTEVLLKMKNINLQSLRINAIP